MFFANSNEYQAIQHALDKSQAIIHFKPDGSILWANANFLGAMGYTLPEIVGRHHSMFVEEAYSASSEYRDFWTSLQRGDFQAAEYKRFGKGGKEIWIQASYNPLKDKRGNVFKVVKYATDITAQTLQNADYKGQIEAIGKSQAVIHFNLDGTIIWANKNFTDTVGYTLTEIQGKHHSMFVEQTYGASKDYDLFWAKLRQGEFQAAEFKRVGKGGKDIWIQASYNPIFDPNGKPFKVVKFATNISAQVQKRIENEKIGSNVEHDLGEISHSLDNVTMQTTSAASAATQTATTVQTIAAGAEELNSSVQEIAQSMSHSKDSVEKVIGLTDNADKSTQSLTSAAEQMSGIVSIIQDIANQINLLALNATIESARAGEAGKGFAVVASEVKNLATQVGQATDKISQEITGMQSISSDVVRILTDIKEAITGVQISVSGVASAIEEQSAVTTEISSNMQVASDACAEVDKNLRDVLDSVSSSTGYVKQVQSLSRQLLN